MNKGEGFTYAILTRSEEKGRDLLETAVYAVFTLSTLLAICQFVAEARPLPTNPGMSIHHRVPKHHLLAQRRAG
jgi:hypothetical protein